MSKSVLHEIIKRKDSEIKFLKSRAELADEMAVHYEMLLDFIHCDGKKKPCDVCEAKDVLKRYKALTKTERVKEVGDDEIKSLKEQLKVVEQERSELQSRAESLERLVFEMAEALEFSLKHCPGEYPIDFEMRDKMEKALAAFKQAVGKEREGDK